MPGLKGMKSIQLAWFKNNYAKDADGKFAA